MAYSDDAVKSKLASLNETQESIASTAQWLMFHRRHADRTVSLWQSRLASSNAKGALILIYLANEVVQQARLRQKKDFLLAFEPLIADSTALAYKSASSDIQEKLKRVVEVWRQRSIFAEAIQVAIEARVREIDEAKGGPGGGGRKLGGTLFGGSGGAGSVPSELEGLAKVQGGVTKADLGARPAVDKANSEYAKLTDPETPVPTAPVHAANLNKLIKHLAAAQAAVDASITARRNLLNELEKLVETQRGRLSEDETTAKDLETRKESIENKKNEVEANIMRGLSTPTSPESVSTPDARANGTSSTTPAGRAGSREIERPEAEGFTPPPPDIETFTPPPNDTETETGDPAPILNVDNEFDAQTDEQHGLTNPTGAEIKAEELQPPNFNEPPPAFEPPPALSPPQDALPSYSPPAAGLTGSAAAAAANDFLNSLNVHQKVGRAASSEIPAHAQQSNGGGGGGSPGDPRLKRRKMSHPKSGSEDDGFLGMNGEGGVDEEGVSALLNG